MEARGAFRVCLVQNPAFCGFQVARRESGGVEPPTWAHLSHIAHIMAFERILVHSRLHLHFLHFARVCIWLHLVAFAFFAFCACLHLVAFAFFAFCA